MYQVTVIQDVRIISAIDSEGIPLPTSFSAVLSGFIFKHLAFIFISNSARLEELNSNVNWQRVEPASAY
jgi:hypothetical protein